MPFTQTDGQNSGAFPSQPCVVILEGAITSIDNLIPIHPPKTPGRVNKLMQSIEQDGFNLQGAIPVIPVEDGTFILAGGHHRVAALRELKYLDAPIVFNPKFTFTVEQANTFLTKINPKKLRILK